MEDKDLVKVYREKCRYLEKQVEKLEKDFKVYCNTNGVQIPPNYYVAIDVEEREGNNPPGITDDEILYKVYDKQQKIKAILLK